MLWLSCIYSSAHISVSTSAHQDPVIWREKTGYNSDGTRSSSILGESLMNSDRTRHSFCSRLRPLRFRTQSTRGRRFTAPSLYQYQHRLEDKESAANEDVLQQREKPVFKSLFLQSCPPVGGGGQAQVLGDSSGMRSEVRVKGERLCDWPYSL